MKQQWVAQQLIANGVQAIGSLSRVSCVSFALNGYFTRSDHVAIIRNRG